MAVETCSGTGSSVICVSRDTDVWETTKAKDPTSVKNTTVGL